MNTHKQAGQVEDLVERYHQNSITRKEIIPKKEVIYHEETIANFSHYFS